MPVPRPPLTDDAVRAMDRLRAEYRFARLRALQESGLDLEEGPFRIASFGHALGTDWEPMHRVYCLDHRDLDRLDELLAWFDEAGRSPLFELLPLDGNRPLYDALSARGFAMRYTISVLLHEGEERQQAPDEGLEVRRSPPEEIDTFIDVYIDGHGWECSAEERAMWIAEMRPQYLLPPISRYVGTCDGRVVAIAASYHHDGRPNAHLINCATLPAFRGRSLQAALIARRVRDLHAAGASIVAADTTPYSSSHRNLERAGFRVAYQKTHWDRARTGS